MIHHDPQKDDTQHGNESNPLFGVLVALFLLVPFLAAGLSYIDYPSKDNQRQTAASDTAKHETKKLDSSAKQDEPPSDTPYYNKPTAGQELTAVYTDALSEAVKNKDSAACQAGLKNFRHELSTAPAAVIKEIEQENTARPWQVPTYLTFLEAPNSKFACDWAKKLDLMGDLVPDTRATQALAIIDSDAVRLVSEGSQKCYDLLSTDYRYYVHNTSAAGKVMLALLTLTLPAELSDEQFATLCNHRLNKQA